MVELRDSIYRKAGTNHDVDQELQNLSARRREAKWDVDWKLEYQTSLLKVSPQSSKDEASKVVLCKTLQGSS